MPPKKVSGDTTKNPEKKGIDQKTAEQILGLLLGHHDQKTTTTNKYIKLIMLFDPSFNSSKLRRTTIPGDVTELNSINTDRNDCDVDEIVDDKGAADLFLSGCDPYIYCIRDAKNTYYDKSFGMEHITETFAVPYMVDGTIQVQGIKIYNGTMIDPGCYEFNDYHKVTMFNPRTSFEKLCLLEPVKAVYIIYSLLGYVKAVKYILRLCPRAFALDKLIHIQRKRIQMYGYCIICLRECCCPFHVCDECSHSAEGKQFISEICANRTKRFIDMFINVDALANIVLAYTDSIQALYKAYIGKKIKEVYYQQPRKKDRHHNKES